MIQCSIETTSRNFYATIRTWELVRFWFELIRGANETSLSGAYRSTPRLVCREWKPSLVCARSLSGKPAKKEKWAWRTFGPAKKSSVSVQKRVSHWGLSEKDPSTIARIGHADRHPSWLQLERFVSLTTYIESSYKFNLDQIFTE